MSANLNEEVIRSITDKASVPLVFKGFTKNWPLTQWNVEKWCSVFGDKEIPFRCLNKSVVSDEPSWERQCIEKKMTFKSFVENLTNFEEWMYFDYKYLHQWFSADSEINKNLSWKEFGFEDKGAEGTTLWVGSSGAHTPAHQDTYGVNIVAQLYGKKRWILFPPETGGLKPTRVPYEESSVYSELNFYCPLNFDAFKGLSGGRLVELSAGDALFVPRGWWHYVQNIDPLNIAMNIWLPHETDDSARVSEALIKIFIAQICKDLPDKTAKLIVNPNEDDISDTPLAVLFLQLETVAKAYLESRRKARRVKRQKMSEDDCTSTAAFDLKSLLENKSNNLEIAQTIAYEDLVNILKGNFRVYACSKKVQEENEMDGMTSSLCLTKAVIDAFTQSNVIELVKQNLFTRLS